MPPGPDSRPWGQPVRLLPLLGLYLLFVLLQARDALIWDEGRYLLNAQNLLKGYLASPETHFLWNGPGYPLYLLPFVALGLPLLLAKLGNAVLLYLSVVYFQGLLRLSGIGRSLAYAYALGIFLLLHGSLAELLMTESLAVLTVTGAAYHFWRLCEGGGFGRHATRASLYLAWLTLTKVLFGYVLVAALLGGAVWWLAAKSKLGRSAAAVCGMGLILCLPYLGYTYKLTGKPFYWSNSGGVTLYCMTVPEKELLGDWLNFDAVLAFPEFFREQEPFFRRLSEMDYVSRDLAFKQAAWKNLKAHPAKFVQNYRANVNRMVFGHPASAFPGSQTALSTGNRSFIYCLPFFLLAAAAWPGWRGRRAMPGPAQACFIFALIALGGQSLLSAVPRMVFPLLPLLALWLVCVAEKALVWEWAGERPPGGEA